MKIKNNRKNFVTLQIRDGVRKINYKFKPEQVIDIPALISLNQVSNKRIFKNGNLSVVVADLPVKETKVKEPKVEEKIEEKSEKKTAEKSKVEEAIENAIDFASDKSTSSKTKTKKSK